MNQYELLRALRHSWFNDIRAGKHIIFYGISDTPHESEAITGHGGDDTFLPSRSTDNKEKAKAFLLSIVDREKRRGLSTSDKVAVIWYIRLLHKKLLSLIRSGKSLNLSIIHGYLTTQIMDGFRVETIRVSARDREVRIKEEQ